MRRVIQLEARCQAFTRPRWYQDVRPCPFGAKVTIARSGLRLCMTHWNRWQRDGLLPPEPEPMEEAYAGEFYSW